ncbi:MAG TPA: hypothetical protein VE760_01840 [Acidimicrobiales bacterium]|jgi:hypothetical protein|nr:hypothetical protein [Acidimicrobiales bacterium]
MLYGFGFDRVGVVVGDLYFVNPEPAPGQEGPERGVRLEVRLLERGELKGNVYSARPIVVDRPVWRADLLESAEGRPGSFDRTHHHPAFRGWDPGPRYFDPALSADPLRWVASRLGDLGRLLDEAGVSREEVGDADAVALRFTVPEIVDAVRRLLEKVWAGELARPPGDAPAESAREGWL